MIDLRSDTVTRPSEAMREVMARAPVGDDVYGEDASVRRLEERTAEILGKEASVFMPTGTMSNQVALRAHTEAGDEILADVGSHIVTSEAGAPAGLSSVLVKPLFGTEGTFSGEDVLGALRTPHPFNPKTLAPPTKLVWIENTHNGAGGSIWPLERIEDVAEAARSRALALHLDGARLWNASAETGIPEATYALPFDSVSVCFSKGLGAPVGSALCGSREYIERARRFRQMFGGGMRQAGILAAAALYALENHRASLREDHRKAKELAQTLAELPGIRIDLSSVQTNIVRFRVSGISPFEFVERCHQERVHMLGYSPDRVRAVLHRDVSREDVPRAMAAIRQATLAASH